MSPRRHRRGAHALEFALLFPVFLAIVAGFVDGGWLLAQKAALDHGLIAGCRAAALENPGRNLDRMDDLRAILQAEAVTAVEGSVTGQCEDCATDLLLSGAAPLESITCTMRRRFTPVTGLIWPEMTLETQATARLEWQWAR